MLSSDLGGKVLPQKRVVVSPRSSVHTAAFPKQRSERTHTLLSLFSDLDVYIGTFYD